MLSDSLRQMRERFLADGTDGGLLIALRTFEVEARNMEERLQFLTGRPHVALEGLISEPVIRLQGSAP